MPPVRIKERARAKKGTLKRLVKELFIFIYELCHHNINESHY